MNMKRIVTVDGAGCAAVVMSAASGVAAQTPPEHKHPAAAQAKPATGMAAKEHAMMAEHDKMMADMKAADQRLDDLVVKMNTASGLDQSAATSNVVTEMVAQRKLMRDGMMKMQAGMMAHMMEHMAAGKESMAACPMMKSMGDMKP